MVTKKSTGSTTSPTSPTSPATSAPTPTIPIPRSMEQGSRDIHLLKHYDRLTSEPTDTITCSDLLVGNQSREYRTAVLRLAQEVCTEQHSITSYTACPSPLTIVAIIAFVPLTWNPFDSLPSPRSPRGNWLPHPETLPFPSLSGRLSECNQQTHNPERSGPDPPHLNDDQYAIFLLH